MRLPGRLEVAVPIHALFRRNQRVRVRARIEARARIRQGKLRAGHRIACLPARVEDCATRSHRDENRRCEPMGPQRRQHHAEALRIVLGADRPVTLALIPDHMGDLEALLGPVHRAQQHVGEIALLPALDLRAANGHRNQHDPVVATRMDQRVGHRRQAFSAGPRRAEQGRGRHTAGAIEKAGDPVPEGRHLQGLALVGHIRLADDEHDRRARILLRTGDHGLPGEIGEPPIDILRRAHLDGTKGAQAKRQRNAGAEGRKHQDCTSSHVTPTALPGPLEPGWKMRDLYRPVTNLAMTTMMATCIRP